MTRATIKISVKQIVLAFCFISFYIPQSYAVPGFVYTVWRASYMIVGLGATLLLFLNARKKTPSKGYFALMAFYLWIFVCSLVFSSTSEFKLYNFVKCVGFISLLEFALLTRNKKKVIEAFLAAVIFISIIHFISFVQYSNLRGGMRHGINYYTAGILRVNSNQNWYFLTYDNNSIYYFLPAIVLLLYYSCNYNIKAIRLWIAYSGFILYKFLVKVSAAALVAMSVIIAGYFLFIRSNKRSPLNHLLSYKNTVLVGMIISIIPVLVVGGELAFNLTSLFGKRTGISGRDIIWS